ncbi:TetR/AcrR family transcriptional regulator [Granulicella sp. WH15]|uniref:TetR/AcrR family transcriptional regulator n=1 Tax=Granulicella sp. WH15 TaxID=2602070 RepID=UPI0013671D99|nr:TetR/AcrR family transcriptional regulator [Granulicella sp. WH15]QHN02871.1 TetR/AcrR family transcriptional regulator [Granulicella sp. WH15]
MRKGEMTRQRIIEEAAPIFNQRGFAGCSMQDVMAATGLEKGGLYRHFATKEELAVEAFRYAVSRSVRTKSEGLDEVEGAVNKLRHLIQQFVESPSRIPGGCPLMNTAVDADDGNEVLRGLAREGIAEWRERLVKIITTGMRAGEIRRDTVPRRLANTLISTVEGALMISRLEGTKTALKDAQTVLEVVLESLGAEVAAH